MCTHTYYCIYSHDEHISFPDLPVYFRLSSLHGEHIALKTKKVGAGGEGIHMLKTPSSRRSHTHAFSRQPHHRVSNCVHSESGTIRCHTRTLAVVLNEGRVRSALCHHRILSAVISLMRGFETMDTYSCHNQVLRAFDRGRVLKTKIFQQSFISKMKFACQC